MDSHLIHMLEEMDSAIMDSPLKYSDIEKYQSYFNRWLRKMEEMKRRVMVIDHDVFRSDAITYMLYSVMSCDVHQSISVSEAESKINEGGYELIIMVNDFDSEDLEIAMSWFETPLLVLSDSPLEIDTRVLTFPVRVVDLYGVLKEIFGEDGL